MATPSKPKRHHYVPRCYLKRFMEGPILYTLDVFKVQSGLKERPKESHPNKICFHEDFYTIKQEFQHSNFRLNQYDPLFVESDVLHEMEHNYTRIFDALTTQVALSLDDAVYVSDFIIQIKIRNPYWLKKVIFPNKNKWIEDSVAKIVAEKGQENDYFNRLSPELQSVVIEGVLNSQRENKNFEKEMQLFGIIQRRSGENDRNEKYRNIIVNSSWMILRAPIEGPYFITSDNPGVAKSQTGEVHNSYFQELSAFYFPLSPQFCLIVDRFKNDNAYINNVNEKMLIRKEATAKHVIQINNLTIQVINNLLVAKDPWYLSQIAELNRPNKK